MVLPSNLIIPFKVFIADNLKKSRAEFMEDAVGPLLMFRIGSKEPNVVDLGELQALGKREVLVGRAEDSDIRVLRNDISNAHVRIECIEETWNITDLDSTNGTSCGQPLHPHRPLPMADQSKYQLGDSVFLQFWQKLSLYKKIKERRKFSGIHLSTDTDPSAIMGDAPAVEAPPAPALKRRSTRAGRPSLGTSRKIYRLAEGKPRDLVQFSAEVQVMRRADFLEQFPCPFLILLTATRAKFLTKEEETLTGAELVVNRGLQSLQYWPIGSRERTTDIVFGRGPTCDLICEHHTISRSQAVFLFDEQADSWHLEDLNSHNGVLVDGERIREKTLLEDEVIFRFGKEVMVQFMRPRTFFEFARLYSLSQGRD